MKKIEHKGLFILCCISLVIAVCCCICYTATTNMIKEKNAAEAKFEQEIGIDVSEYNKSDLSRLEDELTIIRKKYDSSNSTDTSGELVIKEYLEKRYNFKGTNSESCEDVIKSVEHLICEAVAEEIRKEMNMPISGNGNIKEITDHTADVIAVYLDDYTSENLGNTPPGNYQDTTTNLSIKNYYAKAYVNNSQLYYFTFTLQGTENNWTIINVNTRLTEYIGGNYERP